MTNETYKNPTAIVLADPQGLDLALKQLQLKLAALPWLEKCFGRARMFAIQVLNEKRLEPRVYQGGSEYYPVLANDALKSYSFFRVDGGREVEDYTPLTNYGNYFFTDPVDLIFWFNLNEIDRTKDYIFTEELIKDVLDVLSTDPNIKLKTVWDDKVDDIFKGYTLKPEQRDMLMYPFGAFRLAMDVSYPFECGG